MWMQCAVARLLELSVVLKARRLATPSLTSHDAPNAHMSITYTFPRCSLNTSKAFKCHMGLASDALEHHQCLFWKARHAWKRMLKCVRVCARVGEMTMTALWEMWVSLRGSFPPGSTARWWDREARATEIYTRRESYWKYTFSYIFRIYCH